MSLWPLILAISCNCRRGASTEVASCRRSCSRRFWKKPACGRRPYLAHNASYAFRARCRARIKARVTAPAVIEKIRPFNGLFARYWRSVSFAQGVSGTSRDVPFFVSGNLTTPPRRSTCSLWIPQISPRRIVLSTASVTMVGSSADSVDAKIQSSSLLGHSDSDTPRSRMCWNILLSRASSTVGRRTS